MAQRPIREYDAKKMLTRNWPNYFPSSLNFPDRFVQVSPETDLEKLPTEHAWLNRERLVVKPDMIIGKRGKHGLVLLDENWDGVKQWLETKRDSEVKLNNVSGRLTHFLIEPFVETEKEYYISLSSTLSGTEILFSDAGGVDIEELLDSGKVGKYTVGILEDVDRPELAESLLSGVNPDQKERLTSLIVSLYRYYLDLHYAFLEINPFALNGDEFIPLDFKCRLDDAADFEAAKKWGAVSFPAEFGAGLTPEEEYIKNIDEKSGSSLKLTILNPRGKIWTMVAGGGASVVYTDTIADLGYAEEIANYGEYSGDPSTDETYEYAKTILDLMTRGKSPDGEAKYLLIGGGIANFTDVAGTFTGIIKALKEYKDKLADLPVKIYVRRGGPNYQQGLKQMKELGENLGLPIEVYGPETHMTEIVRLALAETGK